jgi:VCBS repeat-containing protein
VGGDQFGAVSEDGVLQAQGQLTVADPDAGEAGFQPVAGLSGIYGSLTLAETGAWTYVLNNNALVVQALAAGEVMTELLAVQTLDGTTAQIAIEVTGAADAGLILGTEGDDRLAGSGADDRLFGLGGNDRLTGRAGDDVLTGGAGGDRFVFAGKFGQDVVADFDTSQAGEVLNLQALDGLRGFADLVAHHLTEVDGDAVITLGRSQIVLDGVAMADLTAQDFLF